MKKRDVEVERLKYENERLHALDLRMRDLPEDYPFNACDNSCVVARPKGMSTNGGCRCDENKLRNVVMHLRARLDFLTATIQELRDGCRPEESYRPLAERFIVDREGGR